MTTGPWQPDPAPVRFAHQQRGLVLLGVVCWIIALIFILSAVTSSNPGRTALIVAVPALFFLWAPWGARRAFRTRYVLFEGWQVSYKEPTMRPRSFDLREVRQITLDTAVRGMPTYRLELRGGLSIAGRPSSRTRAIIRFFDDTRIQWELMTRLVWLPDLQVDRRSRPSLELARRTLQEMGVAVPPATEPGPTG